MNKTIKLTDPIILDCLIYFFGVVLMTQFFTLFFQNVFVPLGFEKFLLDVLKHVDAPYLQASLAWMIEYKKILAPLLGWGIGITAVCLILLIARSIMCFLFGAGFLFVWLLTLHYPGIWTFEFLFPALFGFYAGFASLGQPLITTSFYEKLILGDAVRFYIIFIIAALIWYVTRYAFHDAHLAQHIALYSASSVLLAFAVQWLFDLAFINRDCATESITSCVKRHIACLPWLDMMVITMGAMLIMQVYANFYTDLFAEKGYSELVDYYATATPLFWLTDLLKWSVAHTAILLPLHVVYEIVAAVLLVLLMFRGPVLLTFAGFLLILAFSEIGVSSEWPPTAMHLTWEWELLFVTIVSFLIGLGKMEAFIKADNWHDKMWGPRIFTHCHWMVALLISIIAGLLLYCACMATQIFGETYPITSLSAGITFGLLLMVLFLVDRFFLSQGRNR